MAYFMVSFERAPGKRTSRTFEATSAKEAIKIIEDAGYDKIIDVWERVAHYQGIVTKQLVFTPRGEVDNADQD